MEAASGMSLVPALLKDFFLVNVSLAWLFGQAAAVPQGREYVDRPLNRDPVVNVSQI